MVTPAARREAVTILVETYEMSERRACQVIGADRSSVRYASRRPDDTVLRERMKEVAHDRRRFGCVSACKFDPIDGVIGVQN